MNPEIVSLGEPMLEFNALEEGSLAEARTFTVGWGGDTSNFAVAAARLGGRAGYLTRLGDDEFGQSFLDLWSREGIDTTHIERDSSAPTGIYFISRRGGQHFFTYYRKGSAASRMTPDFLPREYLRQARLLHVSGITQGISTSACDTAFAAMETARDAGVLIAYDPNLRLKLWPLAEARAAIHQAATLADLMLPSYDDARILTELTAPEEIAQFYLDFGAKLVVLKLGPEGALIASPEGQQRYAAFSVEPVDASGAGDAFDAGFCVGYLQGWPLDRCARFANAAGALTTTRLGVVNAIPCLAAVESLLEGA